MMKKTLFCLAAMLFMAPVFADVYKWKDAGGRIHYGDTLPVADTAMVITGEQADDQIANGKGIHAETENSIRQDAMNEARESAKSSGFKVHETSVAPEGLAMKREQIHNASDKEKLAYIVK